MDREAELQNKIKVLQLREEETSLSVAENKLMVHRELESKEDVIRELNKQLATANSKSKLLVLNCSFMVSSGTHSIAPIAPTPHESFDFLFIIAGTDLQREVEQLHEGFKKVTLVLSQDVTLWCSNYNLVFVLPGPGGGKTRSFKTNSSGNAADRQCEQETRGTVGNA